MKKASTKIFLLKLRTHFMEYIRLLGLYELATMVIRAFSVWLAESCRVPDSCNASITSGGKLQRLQKKAFELEPAIAANDAVVRLF
jgi:hypothetical protein